MFFGRRVAAAFSVFFPDPCAPHGVDGEEPPLYALPFPLVARSSGFCSGAGVCCARPWLRQNPVRRGPDAAARAVTGGIHLDGYCDTVDALASNASPERGARS